MYLLANYYSIVHELANARIRGDDDDPDPDDKTSPGYRLEKARIKVFSKLTMSITALRAYAGFQKWEVPIGGKFPEAEYNKILDHVQRYVDILWILEEN